MLTCDLYFFDLCIPRATAMHRARSSGPWCNDETETLGQWNTRGCAASGSYACADRDDATSKGSHNRLTCNDEVHNKKTVHLREPELREAREIVHGLIVVVREPGVLETGGRCGHRWHRRVNR